MTIEGKSKHYFIIAGLVIALVLLFFRVLYSFEHLLLGVGALFYLKFGLDKTLLFQSFWLKLLSGLTKLFIFLLSFGYFFILALRLNTSHLYDRAFHWQTLSLYYAEASDDWSDRTYTIKKFHLFAADDLIQSQMLHGEEDYPKIEFIEGHVHIDSVPEFH